MQAALPLIGIVAVGWVLIVIGFGIQTLSEELTEIKEFRFHPWTVILVMPVMLIMAVVQAVIDRSKLKPTIMMTVEATVSCYYYCNNIIIKQSLATAHV